MSREVDMSESEDSYQRNKAWDNGSEFIETTT